MTPRNVRGSNDVDFARHVRERNAAFQPTNKFKSTAPKGVKYGAGYTDRAKARTEAEGEGDRDSKENRIKALEEQMKLGQIPPETFEALRDRITGGDIESTHLVKGLDRRLLERVRRGENVLGAESGPQGTDPVPDVDDELDKLGEKEVEPAKKEATTKKGNLASPPLIAGVKRSRDEIMAELKAQRKAAAEAKPMPALDNRWRRVGQKERSRIQIDHKGREVLISVDEDGIVKKKVRKIPPQESAALNMPDARQPVLGADAIIPKSLNYRDVEQHEEDEDDDNDIFEGVGTEYNPLGDEDDEGDDTGDESEDEKKAEQSKVIQAPTVQTKSAENGDADEAREKPNGAPRNYFKNAASTTNEETRDRMAGVQDLLKKAAKMDSARSEDADDDDNESREVQEARRKKRAEMLSRQDRDLEDMDIGFGGSRFDDGEDDMEGKKVRISEWKGSSARDGDDCWFEDKKGDGGKKKRKPKKRKGDVNNAADIMRVIEGRRGALAK